MKKAIITIITVILVFAVTFISSDVILSYTQTGHKITTGIILLLLLIIYYLYGKQI